MGKASLAQWLERLETLHPNAIDLGLERVASVAHTLGLLPLVQPVITVAGTNGKGSTVAVLEAITSQVGLVSGSFTSPHLLRFNERIRVGGAEAGDDEIVAAFEAVDRARGQTGLTFFEFATLAAFLVFRARKPDIVVLEVGLGGRLDAVNIVDPTVAVITSIDLDHQQWLGDSRDAIALEKAGIVRSGRPLVIGDPRPPAELLAAVAGARPVYRLGRDYTVTAGATGWRGVLTDRDGAQRSLPGQPRGPLLPANICCALQAALAVGLEFSDEAFERALAVARPRGRCETHHLAGKHYLLDVAHNPAAVDNLIKNISASPCKGKTFAFFSAMADKDIKSMIEISSESFDGWFLADQPTNPRAARAADVAALLRDYGQDRVSVSKDLPQAWRRAQQEMSEGDRLVVFGSFYTVGEAARLFDRDSCVGET
jgi:dihydrofolate synthase/folylpolyglutamate synthase